MYKAQQLGTPLAMNLVYSGHYTNFALEKAKKGDKIFNLKVHIILAKISSGLTNLWERIPLLPNAVSIATLDSWN